MGVCLHRVSLLVAVALLLAGCAGSEEPLTGTSERPGSLLSFGDWPTVAEAKIRPGAVVIVDKAACTANFLFRSPDNETLYLGVAAHCFGLDPSEAVPIGTSASIGGIANAGTVAYNGWSHNDADWNDFGLVKISNTRAARSLAHPAMIHFGGPIGLGDSDSAEPTTRVMTYGNSVQRGEDDPQNPREGRVLLHQDDLLSVVTNYPGIQGDSGSGLMTIAGEAIGVLSTGIVNPLSSVLDDRDVPTVNNYVELDTVLDYAVQQDPGLAGIQLVTWPLLRGPSLPLVAEPTGWQAGAVRYLSS